MPRVALFLHILLVSSLCSAQDGYPSKPITMVVPFPPGGVAELVGRPLAASMQPLLKQPVVIVNRPGAGGAVGMASVAKGPSDGYTILMGLSSISIFPVSDRINGKTPAYELSDFAPIALVTADPTILVVRTDGPYKTVKDFVDAAKANPGKINYSSSGVYGTLHVAMEIFANSAGIRLFHVPYQGGGPAVTAASGGHIPIALLNVAEIAPQAKSGKLRALIVTSGERAEASTCLPSSAVTAGPPPWYGTRKSRMPAELAKISIATCSVPYTPDEE